MIVDAFSSYIVFQISPPAKPFELQYRSGQHVASLLFFFVSSFHPKFILFLASFTVVVFSKLDVELV